MWLKRINAKRYLSVKDLRELRAEPSPTHKNMFDIYAIYADGSEYYLLSASDEGDVSWAHFWERELESLVFQLCKPDEEA